MSTDYILTIDLETTGLDPATDRIVELAAILTDGTGREIDRFHRVIPTPRGVWAETAPVVLAMHYGTGLVRETTDLADGTLGEFLDRDYRHAHLDLHLSRWLIGHVGQGGKGAPVVVLHGSGVPHMERPWMAENLPATFARLAFWTWDVGILRRMLGAFGIDTLAWTGAKVGETKVHRAMEDAEDHLREMLTIMGHLRHHLGIPAPAPAPVETWTVAPAHLGDAIAAATESVIRETVEGEDYV